MIKFQRQIDRQQSVRQQRGRRGMRNGREREREEKVSTAGMREGAKFE
jgi:hypothetical protein